MKNCLVIGGAGFIGSNLVDGLLSSGNSVKVIDDLSTGFVDNINDAAEFIEADISEDGVEETLAPHFEGVDYVFHLAAMARVQPSIEDPVRYDAVNVGGTLRMLKLAADANVEKFVFSSSSSVYGDPEYTPTDEDHPTNPISPSLLNPPINPIILSITETLGQNGITAPLNKISRTIPNAIKLTPTSVNCLAQLLTLFNMSIVCLLCFS